MSLLLLVLDSLASGVDGHARLVGSEYVYEKESYVAAYWIYSPVCHLVYS